MCLFLFVCILVGWCSFSCFRSDIEVIVNQIVFEEPLITESKKPHLRRLIYSKYMNYILLALLIDWVPIFTELIEKLESNESSDFFLFKILRAHILPLTNCAFNKSGDKFITGSYDRTCKVWNTITGDELLTLEGHRNVVYAIAFNNPYGDKIITGSFGKFLNLKFFLLICPFPKVRVFCCHHIRPSSSLSFSFLHQSQTKPASYGVLRQANYNTLTVDMQPKLCVCRLTLTGRNSPPGRWTTRRVCGTWRRVNVFTPCWDTLQRLCRWILTHRGRESSQVRYL